MAEKTEVGATVDHHHLLKQALRALEQMKQKLTDAERRSKQPIAIIGIGCRFPGGVKDAASFWQLLKGKRDAICEVPRDRWKIDDFYDADGSNPGKMVSRYGGFLEEIDQFDAAFFGIAPREAAMMDPQQRLLVEVVWQALEDAAIAPSSLAGSRTGMYLGMASGDYAQLQLHAEDARLLDVHYASGNAHSVASGRLSYILGLKGPSLTVDTACSSSLVAVHLACQAIRTGDCGMAITGGVNLILAPETTVALSQAHMLAPNGKCKVFDDRADGFTRAEGCGVVILKALGAALKDGDRVLAVIRGTALNQDGASSSLTAPHGPSQEELMRRALIDAGLEASDIGYVEAHGTGTALGDPIELQALGSVYGRSRSGSEPLLVGSLKTNLGHMEAAAGIGGLIKLVLALRHGEVPAHLQFEKPTTHVNWEEINIAVPTDHISWPGRQGRAADKGLRIGAVSSFGFSGTNAHLVVAQGPDFEEIAEDGVQEDLSARGAGFSPRILPLSARSSEALSTLVSSYGAWLAGSQSRGFKWADVASTAAIGRDHYESRMAVVAHDGHEALDFLRGWVNVPSRDHSSSSSMTFCFTGQGSEHRGMGLELLSQSEAFRSAVERMDRALTGVLDKGIATLWTSKAGELEQARYVQPAIYAYGFALSELWRSWGIEPRTVLGHSLGEYIAATVAGVMTPEEGVTLVAMRGRLTEELAQDSAMVAIGSSLDDVRSLLTKQNLAGELSIAAINSPTNTVVSGNRNTITAFEEELNVRGLRHKRLRTTHGFHSAALDPMLDALKPRRQR